MQANNHCFRVLVQPSEFFLFHYHVLIYCGLFHSPLMCLLLCRFRSGQCCRASPVFGWPRVFLFVIVGMLGARNVESTLLITLDRNLLIVLGFPF